jgi:hypothetical protein
MDRGDCAYQRQQYQQQYQPQYQVAPGANGNYYR